MVSPRSPILVTGAGSGAETAFWPVFALPVVRLSQLDPPITRTNERMSPKMKMIGRETTRALFCMAFWLLVCGRVCVVGVSDVVCPGAAPGGGLASHFNRGCGGFTAGWSYLYMRYLKLYPRSFGEHTRTISNSAVSAGSSPLARGPGVTIGCCIEWQSKVRLTTTPNTLRAIFARAGNIFM